ncbi:MAG: SDR family oxidoreductase [Chloroflexi bacterium]|nr:SDR family oxidoreductase [Chloroflexota bacterium]
MELEGRRVLVTGAASGIGRATVERLERGGARVAAFDVAPPAEGTDVETVRWWRVDVAQEPDVAAATAEAAEWLGGQVDVLVHVAGIMRAQRAPVHEIPVDVWDEVMSVNLRGTFLMVKHVIPRLPPGGGALVLVSSVAGVFVGSGSFPYGASKGGMHGLAMTLEERLQGTGIRVTELCPGSVHTPLLEASLAEATRRAGDASYRDAVTARWIEPAQVAEVLAFLASPAADILRGTIRTI